MTVRIRDKNNARQFLQLLTSTTAFEDGIDDLAADKQAQKPSLDENLAQMSNQLQGIPMDSLIGGPLSAAVKAQQVLAQSMAEFVDMVGFEPSTNDKDDNAALRCINFKFNRNDSGTTPRKISLQVPLLSIVPIPDLQIDTVDIVFDMPVNAPSKDRAFTRYEPSSLNVQNNEDSVKYHVAIHATTDGMPDGLARVMDILATPAPPNEHE